MPIFSKKNIEKPATVVLFDEIEKGHTDLHDTMLQITDDGLVTLNNGEVVSFRETIIILSSNHGAQEMRQEVRGRRKLGFALSGAEPTVSSTNDTIDRVAIERFDRGFKPEFIGRIDAKIVYHPFSEEGMGRLLDAKVQAMNDMYHTEHGVRLSLTDVSRAHLIATGMQSVDYGARPLEKYLKKTIFSDLSRYTESGMVGEGTHVRVFHRDELPDDSRPAELKGEFVYASKSEPWLRKVRTMQFKTKELMPAPAHAREEEETIA